MWGRELLAKIWSANHPADGSIEQITSSYVKDGVVIDMAMLPPLSGSGWREAECAHIDRLRTMCKNTLHWELESGRTDTGDPWCVIYDRHQHLIILHFARINRRYVIVWPQLKRSANRATIATAVDLALTGNVP